MISFSIPIKGVEVCRTTSKDKKKIFIDRERLVYHADTQVLVMISETKQGDIPFKIMNGNLRIVNNTVFFNNTDFDFVPAGNLTIEQEINQVMELMPDKLETVKI
jgi:hypothetical protein